MSAPTEEFWQMAGIGLMVFLICLGLGSCTALVYWGRP